MGKRGMRIVKLAVVIVGLAVLTNQCSFSQEAVLSLGKVEKGIVHDASSKRDYDKKMLDNEVILVCRYQPFRGFKKSEYEWPKGDPAASIPRISESELRDLKELGFNGIDFWPVLPEREVIDEFLNDGYYIVCASQELVAYFRARSKRPEEGVNLMLDYWANLTKKHGDKVWWLYNMETGINRYRNDYLWGMNLPTTVDGAVTKEEAYHRFKRWWFSEGLFNPTVYFGHGVLMRQKGMTWAKTNELRKKWFHEDGQPELPGYLPVGLSDVSDYCKAHNIDIKDLNLMMGASYHPLHLHYQAEWGAKLIMPELNCSCSNAQLGVAMGRGAARQNEIYWGVHCSGGGGPLHGYHRYNEKGVKGPRAFSESLYLREWIMSYLSGAKIITVLEEPACQAHFMDEKGKKRLSPLGKYAKSFSDFALRRHPDRGKPYVPFAVMLEYHHGWVPREHEVWWGAVPYGREEEMIDNFFNLAFPGQEKAAYSYYSFAKWFRPGEKKPWPWSTKEEYLKMYDKGLVDQRCYEKGILTDSTWGDSFDIVLENCPLEVLSEYKVVILLGGIKLNTRLKKKLTSYVEQGGIVMLNTTQVSRDDEEFLGVELINRMDRSRHQICGERQYEGGYYQVVKPITAMPIMQNRDKKTIAATSNRIGKGEIILTTIPFLRGYIKGGESGIAECYKYLFNQLFARFLLADVQGPPIEYLVNKTEKGIIVTLINNGGDFWNGDEDETWKGKIVVPKANIGGKARVTEWWNDVKVNFKEKSDRIIIDAEVEPFGFKIYGIGEFKEN